MSSTDLQLPFSELTEERVLQDLQKYYGLTGRLKQLGSCQDINFRLKTPDAKKYVVKYLNKSITREDIRFQHQILDFLESFHNKKQFIFPYPAKRIDENTTIVEFSQGNGDKYHMCVLDYVDGEMLSDFKYLHDSTLFEIGRDIATFNQLLNSFPISDDYGRTCEWDMRRAYEICEQRKSAIKDGNLQEKLMLMAFKNYEVVLQYDLFLRHQLVHSDLADYNIIASKDSIGRPVIKGIIDFGDIVESWLVGDLAISIVTLLVRKHQDPISMIKSVVKGFCSVTPLNDSELRCLWHLILLRAILSAMNVSYILESDPTNQYLQDERILNFEVLERLIAIPLPYAINAILSAGNALNINLNEIANAELGFLLKTESNVALNTIPIDLSFANPLFFNGNWKDERGVVANIIKQTIADSNSPENAISSPGKGNDNSRLLGSKSFSLTQGSQSLLNRTLSNPLFAPTLTNSTKPGFSLNSNSLNIFEIKYGTAWFTHSEIRTLQQPKTITTFSIYYLPKSMKLYAPWNGTAKICDDPNHVELLFHDLKKVNKDMRFGSFSSPKVLEISNDIYTLLIYGLHVASPLTFGESTWNIHKGDKIGDVNSEILENNYCPVFFQFFLNPKKEMKIYPKFNTFYPNLFVSENEWNTYQLFCLDPTLLINGALREAILSPSRKDQTISTSFTSPYLAQPINKRLHYVSACQEYYYQGMKRKTPPQIERGFQEFLFDVNGRGYLDMVNNVAVIGHSHQRIADNAYHQLTRLNTNSRFIYAALGDFAEKIISNIPNHIRAQGKLNRVFFVNSGSEATDLALRIARTVVSERRMKEKSHRLQDQLYEFHRDVICIQGGYHGITTASDEVSTTLNDNPRSLETRASWIHLVPMPNHYRGLYRCDPVEATTEKLSDLASKYAELVRQKVQAMKESGCPPTAFIAEPLSGNAGGVILPPTYLAKVYDIIHEAGGLCINDEVQVGYGRLGNVFWGFEEHGIVPDMITMAKAAGNGHPLGYVITSEEIANEFYEAQGSFFSSAGGGPVSCIVGMTVLDVIQDEELQNNSYLVGNYLHEKLLQLQKKYPKIIGCIHGHGLYQGIEIIKSDIESKSNVEEPPVPGTAEAYAICDRLLELGVITHNTGDYSNVLKVKPPLCLNKADADFFIQALEIALEGW